MGDSLENVEVRTGDVLLRRVTNGWIAQRFVESDAPLDDPQAPEILRDEAVFEDRDDLGKARDAESLSRALVELFDGYFQRKREGGLTIEYHDEGREAEEAKLHAAEEAYPPSWVRVDLMVSPTGEMRAIGGEREDGEGDVPYIGLERIKTFLVARGLDEPLSYGGTHPYRKD